MMLGGWLDLVFIYTGRSLGFLYGWYDSEDRFNVTSKKLTALI